MFGTVLRVAETGALVLTNEKCYNTEMKFISSQRIDPLLCLVPGSKIYFDDTKVALSDYFNCKRCHKSLQENEECACDEKRLVDLVGVLIKKENRSYPTGLGLKVSLQCGDRTLHSVIFQSSALHSIFNDYVVGELISFKAILMKTGDQHDLGKIFHARKSLIQGTKAVMHDLALKRIDEVTKIIEQKRKGFEAAKPALHDLALKGIDEATKYDTKKAEQKLRTKRRKVDALSSISDIML